MKFEAKLGNFLLRQMAELPEKERNQIFKKIDLLERNPYKYKSVYSEQFSKVFRIRLNLQGKEMRLIYALLEPNILIACLIDRNKGYADLEKILAEIKKDQDLFLLRKK